jgi:hypothetical protein
VCYKRPTLLTNFKAHLRPRPSRPGGAPSREPVLAASLREVETELRHGLVGVRLVGRVGEDEVDAVGGELAHDIDAVAVKDAVWTWINRAAADGGPREPLLGLHPPARTLAQAATYGNETIM